MNYVKTISDLKNGDEFIYLKELVSKKENELYKKPRLYCKFYDKIVSTNTQDFVENINPDEEVILLSELHLYLIEEYEKRLQYINEDTEKAQTLGEVKRLVKELSYK